MRRGMTKNRNGEAESRKRYLDGYISRSAGALFRSRDPKPPGNLLIACLNLIFQPDDFVLFWPELSQYPSEANSLLHLVNPLPQSA